MTRTTHLLASTSRSTAAVLLPVASLGSIGLLITGLTALTQAAERTIGIAGYLAFAAVATAICLLVGAAGTALSASAGAVRFGISLGWLLFGAFVLLLALLSFIPPEPPWTSWRSFRSFIALLGTPVTFGIATASYTVGFAVRPPRRRWLIVAGLAALPGAMIALYGFLDPSS